MQSIFRELFRHRIRLRELFGKLFRAFIYIQHGKSLQHLKTFSNLILVPAPRFLKYQS